MRLKFALQRFSREVLISSQLSHPNIVPFIGVYSTPLHPFALVYEMMDHLDIGQYLVENPNVSKLKLVSTGFALVATGPHPPLS